MAELVPLAAPAAAPTLAARLTFAYAAIMRLELCLLAPAVLALTRSDAAAASPAERMPKSYVATDVDLSEFAAPMQLVLDLDTGRYAISPPPRPWSPGASYRPRTGALRGRQLARFRELAQSVVGTGIDDSLCLASGGRSPTGVPIVHLGSLGGTPRISVSLDGTTLTAADLLVRRGTCWTKPAQALVDALEETFERKTP